MPRSNLTPEFLKNLRLLRDVSRIGDHGPLSPRDNRIIQQVMIGLSEGRPYDITSLSKELDIPFTSLHHHIGKLRKRAFIEVRTEGVHARLYPTSAAVAIQSHKIDNLLKLIKDFGKK